MVFGEVHDIENGSGVREVMRMLGVGGDLS